ncbi:hypothetical protein [Notoacmeibacter sp. MSK16QG-6]|uniref:hypothetical protein n=1 Tax=Notoacmeibacter sp. MSK16QG-6 TaxID=2957982 RepID=UPI00209D8B7B|nr:hypothetical protein [Notoacmeibacter sp. MSK16QG-6]MCP1201089.1 hypothetical protein [Notoacmeibacter sp. MSK16QG-6]
MDEDIVEYGDIGVDRAIAEHSDAVVELHAAAVRLVKETGANGLDPQAVGVSMIGDVLDHSRDEAKAWARLLAMKPASHEDNQKRLTYIAGFLISTHSRLRDAELETLITNIFGA